jgi:hypothetical protein
MAVVGEHDAFRTQAHVGKQGRRAGASIVDERHGALGDIGHITASPPAMMPFRFISDFSFDVKKKLALGLPPQLE